MISRLSIVLLVCITNILKAQCDSTSDIRNVFAALNIDEHLPFLQGTTLYLRPQLDKESLAIVKDGLSRKYYVRQLNQENHIIFDTLKLSDNEIAELDSIFSRNPQKWANSRVLDCRIGRPVQIYNQSSKTSSGAYLTTYQLLEPIFLRGRTLAFAFYKREIPDIYSEFTVLIKKSDKWEVWDKIIIGISH